MSTRSRALILDDRGTLLLETIFVDVSRRGLGLTRSSSVDATRRDTVRLWFAFLSNICRSRASLVGDKVARDARRDVDDTGGSCDDDNTLFVFAMAVRLVLDIYFTC